MPPEDPFDPWCRPDPWYRPGPPPALPGQSPLAAEYEQLVRAGQRPENVARKYWNKELPGPERVAIVRRYRKSRDPDDPGPRWLNCPCTDHGGAISMQWGHSPYCEWCGSSL